MVESCELEYVEEKYNEAVKKVAGLTISTDYQSSA